MKNVYIIFFALVQLSEAAVVGDVSLPNRLRRRMNGRIWPRPDPFTVVTGQPRCVGWGTH